MTRRGFTLAELIIAMVVLAILGLALMRILISNSRFVSGQEAMMEARSTARAAMQAMLAELHMVGDGGLIAASRDSVTVRVPYAFGMTCRRTGSVLTVSLMPYDSLPFALAQPDSIAIRDDVTGSYTTFNITSTSYAPTPSDCTADSVRTVPGGHLTGIRLSWGWWSVPSKALFYLSQTVTYKFMTSADLPGRRGLWRRVGGGTYEEMAAPFDTTARFAFLRGPLLQVSTTAPSSGTASRDSVRGLELRLTGQSVSPATGASGPARFDLRTTLTFMNCKGSQTCTQP
jgi:prepilin-type N-terminal cleavage/methylation domain-containing protein